MRLSPWKSAIVVCVLAAALSSRAMDPAKQAIARLGEEVCNALRAEHAAPSGALEARVAALSPAERKQLTDAVASRCPPLAAKLGEWIKKLAGAGLDERKAGAAGARGGAGARDE